MKKILLLLLALLLFAFFANAEYVSMDTAKKIAENWYNYWNDKDMPNSEIDKDILKNYNGHKSYYVFTFKSGGFVMVSANNSTIPVLGYSLESPFEEEIKSENVKAWLDRSVPINLYKS